jgi:death-on-curing protein
VKEPQFLAVGDVLRIHRRVLMPGESAAVLSHPLLESAVMAPRQTFGGRYLCDSLEEMAAAYLIGLVSNHPFENGNKRVGATACAVFLRINGRRLVLTQEEMVLMTLNAVNHVWDRAATAAFVQRHTE